MQPGLFRQTGVMSLRTSSPRRGSKSCSMVLICTTSLRIPASSSTNQRTTKGDLIQLWERAVYFGASIWRASGLISAPTLRVCTALPACSLRMTLSVTGCQDGFLKPVVSSTLYATPLGYPGAKIEYAGINS